ncbi:TPA: hypothetical protein P0E37_004840 [Vibrio campbellii]|nr:hypothetical protein [Vibrio campbellii]
MNEQYNLEDYRADLFEAHAKYTEVVREHCVGCNSVIIPLSDDEIHEVKASANGYKNQLLSAAGKRLRAGIALRLLDELKGDFDLTATLAVYVSKELLGRAINRNVLIERYATKSRTAADKTVDIARLSLITQTPEFELAKVELANTLLKAKDIRLEVSEKVFQGGEGEAFKLLSQSAIKYKSSL